MAEVVLVLTWAAVLLMGRGAWGGSATPARRALWVALLALHWAGRCGYRRTTAGSTPF